MTAAELQAYRSGVAIAEQSLAAASSLRHSADLYPDDSCLAEHVRGFIERLSQEAAQPPSVMLHQMRAALSPDNSRLLRVFELLEKKVEGRLP